MLIFIASAFSSTTGLDFKNTLAVLIINWFAQLFVFMSLQLYVHFLLCKLKSNISIVGIDWQALNSFNVKIQKWEQKEGTLAGKKYRDLQMNGTHKHTEAYWYVSAITDVFLNIKTVNACKHAVKMVDLQYKTKSPWNLRKSVDLMNKLQMQ